MAQCRAIKAEADHEFPVLRPGNRIGHNAVMGERDTAEEVRAITTTVLFAGENRDLLRAGVAVMVEAAIADGELRGVALDGRCAKDSRQLQRFTAEARQQGHAVVILLLDPVGPYWLEAADDLRADDRVAIIPLVARPNFAVQRAWRRRTPSGVPKASGILAVNSRADHLTLAIQTAAATPRETGFWIDRDIDNQPVARHPAQFLAGVAPQSVVDILRKPNDHQKVVLAAYMPNKEAAAAVGIKRDSFTEKLKEIRENLEAPSDVALGRIATEYGLFEDVPADWWELIPDKD